MPRLRQRGRGDILVRVNVRVPTKLSGKEREALRELGNLDGETFNESKSFFQKLKGVIDG
jgi:molecular chaperone DnaJ